MSDPSANAPTPPATPPTPDPAPAAPAPAQDPPAPAPGTDWKAEARKWEKLAKTNTDAATKLQALEDAKKTDEQKLADELAALKADSSTAKSEKLRLEVALDKAPEGLSPAKIRKLAERLRGSNREELEADAVELFADFGAAKTPDEGDPSKPGQPKPDPAQGSRGTPPAGRPTSMGAAIAAQLKKT